ncbi:MAG: serine/threonine protein kinase [Gammaproteobacteria bacterium]|nr:serine/threonine protein kinase [Gammaproteobacteria bacterium]
MPLEIQGYDIQRRIGEGGMATAYLAVQKSLGRRVVLKVLDTGSAESQETVERFLNEGRIVAALNHPHIITIFDIGIAPDCVYMSMEYVEGGDLKRRIENSVFTPAQALDLVVKIASALDVAHRNGIVHRDVKPGNILFRNDGTPLLSDFGIAKQLSLDHDLTHTGIFLGSPNYMAPEQASAGPIDGRVDIYALGVIFYEMLTGSKPYRSDSVVDIILQHKQAPIPRLPNGLDQYQPLFELMIAKNRKDRFRDCAALIHYIQQLLASGVVKTTAQMTAAPDLDITGEYAVRHPEIAPVEALPRLRRQPPIHGALVILLVVAAGAFAGLYYAEPYVSGEAAREDLPQAVAPLPPPVEVAPVPVPPGDGAQPRLEEVAQALAWLGHKSLEDFRLTSPARDNAHYYFSRLLQIDPGNAAARRGMAQIAERFAFLAERELANEHLPQAHNYIEIGLQVDPANQTLLALQGLSQSGSGGLLHKLKSLFGSG